MISGPVGLAANSGNTSLGITLIHPLSLLTHTQIRLRYDINRLTLCTTDY